MKKTKNSKKGKLLLNRKTVAILSLKDIQKVKGGEDIWMSSAARTCPFALTK